MDIVEQHGDIAYEYFDRHSDISDVTAVTTMIHAYCLSEEKVLAIIKAVMLSYPDGIEKDTFVNVCGDIDVSISQARILLDAFDHMVDGSVANARSLLDAFDLMGVYAGRTSPRRRARGRRRSAS